MRKLLCLLMFVVFCGLLSAQQPQQVQVTVPAQAWQKRDEICNLVRDQENMRAITYSQCAEIIFRRGMISVYAKKLESDEKTAILSFRQDLNDFRITKYPHPAPDAIRRCGDGVLDEATEQCDDGNLIDGDGCSSSCMVE